MENVALKYAPQPLLKPSEAFALLQDASNGKLQGACNEGVMGGQSIAESGTEESISTPVNLKEWFGVNLSQRSGDSGDLSLGLLVDISFRKELLDSTEICPVPYSPQWLSGFVNVRGQITPVFSLARFFGLSAGPSGSSSRQTRKKKGSSSTEYLLFIDLGSESFAIEISGFPQKLSLSTGTRLDKKPSLPPELMICTGSVYHSNGLWCEWNLDAFQRRVSEMYNSG